MKWLVALLAACSGKHATATEVDWKACEAALRQAAAEPLDARPQHVIDGCRVCGDWQPLLDWNTPHDNGGPTRPAIENAMVACNAYCDPNAKQRFLGTLDNARGMAVRTPWRLLGELCKDKVSAVPDTRYMTAPFFALDRIGRAASARSELASALAAVELPLPAVSLTGAGVMLPTVASVVPTAGPLSITVLGGMIFVGKLPRGRLAATGVVVDLGPDPYPGKQVKLDELAAELTRLAAGAKTPIALLAPKAMAALELAPIITAASAVAPIHLAANATGAPEGWDLPGTIPVPLVAPTSEMTVQDLAAELAKRAAR